VSEELADTVVSLLPYPERTEAEIRWTVDAVIRAAD
jgi:hypothetical protein